MICVHKKHWYQPESCENSASASAQSFCISAHTAAVSAARAASSAAASAPGNRPEEAKTRSAPRRATYLTGHDAESKKMCVIFYFLNRPKLKNTGRTYQRMGLCAHSASWEASKTQSGSSRGFAASSARARVVTTWRHILQRDGVMDQGDGGGGGGGGRPQ